MDPPDFNPDSISDILSGLTEEDIQNISRIAQGFTGKNSSRSAEKNSDEGSGFSLDPEMLLRLMSIFEKLNSQQNDPRCNLIRSLKPLLSPARQKKADTAIELMKIFSIFSQGDLFNL